MPENKQAASSTPPAQVPESKPPAPQPVDLDALFSDPRIDERLGRIAESKVRQHLDPVVKRQRAIEDTAKNFDAVVERLGKQGLLKEGADIVGLRNQAVMEAASRPDPEADPATSVKPQGSGETATPQADPVYQEGTRLASKFGLTGSDPEAALIVSGQGVQAWLNSIELAGKTRQARVAKETGGASGVEALPLDPGTTQGDVNQIANITDPTALLELGFDGKGKR